MAANLYTVYPNDWAANLMQTGSATVAGSVDSPSTGTSRYALDIDNVSKWTPQSGGAAEININLGAARSIIGWAISNHNLSGETLSFYTRATWSGSKEARGTLTSLPAGDLIILLIGGAVTKQFTGISIDSTVNSGAYVGSISVLDSTYQLECMPLRPLPRPLSPGYGAVIGAGGHRVNQALGGAQQEFTLRPKYVKVDTGEVWALAEQSWRDSDGWAKGVWFKDDTDALATDTGDLNAYRGYYCHPVGQLSAQIIAHRGRIQGEFTLQTLLLGSQL